MKNRSAGNMKNLLEEKISELGLQTMHLQAIRKTLHNRYDDMVTLLTIIPGCSSKFRFSDTKRTCTYSRQEGLTLSGFSYEKGINETVIDRMEDYIVQIEIPVC